MTTLSDPEVQEDPFAYYAEQRAKCPVWHEPDIDLYVVGAMEEARRTLTDAETFSNTPRKSKPNPVAVAYVTTLAERGWARASTLQRTDPPIHTRYRKILNRVFTPGRVRTLTPGIDAIVAELLDAFLPSGRCEFVGDLALPLPGMFIAEQLGLDRSQYRTFRRWAEAMLCLASRPNMTMDEAMEMAEIELEAQHYLAAEVEKRRADPGDDLISLIVHAAAADDSSEGFSMNEMQDLMHQLVTGGFETTTGALAKAMYLLVTHPEQQELLRAQRDLLSNFIEEALRFDSPVQGLWRKTTCPVNMGGVAIDKDASVMVRYGSANRDPLVFANPDLFDITRTNASHHVAFGLGAHFCLGAALARQEMMSAFTALLDQTSWIALDGELPAPIHDPSFFLHGMSKLPLTLT